MKSISLVIPTLNEQDTISKLLISAKNQTVPFKEIILVDSGSNDNTLNIARKYIKQIIVTGKKCVNHNRNVGVESATSDIVAMVDADCILPKDYSEKVIKGFSSDKTVALVAPVFPIEKSVILKVIRGLNNIWLYFLSHLTVSPYAANMPVLRKAFIDAKGFPMLKSSGLSEDELYHRLTKMGDVIFEMDAFLYTSSRKFTTGNNSIINENKSDCMEMV